MPDDTKSPLVDKKKASEPVSKPKEQEPESVDSALSQIQEREREAAATAEKEITDAIGKETKTEPREPEIPPDVEAVGVKAPEKHASDLLKKGSDVEIPVSEEVYKKGENTKLEAKVTVKREVYGVSSIIALAMFIGRMIKKAHHSAKNVVFKKEG